jgi:hypothetical protein
MDVDPRVVTMVAEMRAMELYSACRNLVMGASHSKLEAENLLMLIDAGVPPVPLRNQHTHNDQEAA